MCWVLLKDIDFLSGVLDRDKTTGKEVDSENYLSSDMIKEMLKDSKAILGCHGLKHIYYI